MVAPLAHQRNTGFAPAGIANADSPLCALGVCDLSKEYDPQILEEPLAVGQARTRATKVIFHRERECDRFVRWIPGLSPKEHIDMNILERQQAWQARRDSKDFRLNCLLVVVAVASMCAAWWAALHPTVIPIPQRPTIQQNATPIPHQSGTPWANNTKGESNELPYEQ
jgi:cytoskeletal protein RodZ